MLQDPASLITSPESRREFANALPTPPVSPPKVTRDSEFYCRDIVFLVENVLFKVSRRPFEDESNAFGSTIKLPPENGHLHAEGTSDVNPLPLPGVTAEEFKALLYVLFPLSYGARQPLTKDQWLSVLKLADMWVFDEVRAKAIEELRRLIPNHAERICVARNHNIRGWIETALNELAKQDSLTSADMQFLGWDMAAKLIVVRESVAFSGSCSCGCNYCTISHGPVAHAHAHAASPGTRPFSVSAGSLRRSTDFSNHIRELFGDEFF